MILAGMLSHIYQLRVVEETQVVRWGTTIYDRDLKDWEGTVAESTKDEYREVDNQ